jgi:hypothetical protein
MPRTAHHDAYIAPRQGNAERHAAPHVFASLGMTLGPVVQRAGAEYLLNYGGAGLHDDCARRPVL